MTFGLSKPENQPNVITDTAYFTWNYSAFDTGHESLGAKGSKPVAEGVAAALIWKSKWNSNKVDTLPVENNPALARELMDFFEEKRELS